MKYCLCALTIFFAALLFVSPNAAAEQDATDSESDTVTLTREQYQKLLERLDKLEKEVKDLKETADEKKKPSTEHDETVPGEVDEADVVVEPPRKFLGLFGDQSEGVPSLDLSGFIVVEFGYTNFEKDGRFNFEGIEIEPRFNLFEELQVGADLEFSEPRKNEDDFYVEQAYIAWAPYYDRQLELTMGRFNSIIGIEDPDPARNLMATESFFSEHLIPADQTGLMVAYRFRSIRLFGVASNSFGYDDAGDRIASDNNRDNTYTGRFEWRPSDDHAIGLNIVAGPERDLNNHDYRVTFDIDYQHAVKDFYYIGLEVLYGTEENDSGNDPSWFGAMAIANFDFSKQLDTAIRLEYVDDSDGGARFKSTDGNGNGSKVWSAAAALKFHPLDNMDIVLEYRFDSGDEGFFEPEDNRKTFTIEVRVTF
ncbi:MAG: outer membrane beta-barrel protein [Planctomycetota bacterium]|nr:outer membrane beta-barrel protein [Planctomycetota bacterium]